MENLVKKNAIYLGMEEIKSTKTGTEKTYVKHRFSIDAENYDIFDNEDKEYCKQLSSQGIKQYDKCCLEGEFKLRRGEKNSFWSYDLKNIKKM